MGELHGVSGRVPQRRLRGVRPGRHGRLHLELQRDRRDTDVQRDGRMEPMLNELPLIG